MLQELIQGGYGIDEDLSKPLKDNYRTEEKKCREVILKVAEILDKIVIRELNKREG
jgi:hypothetical protein